MPVTRASGRPSYEGHVAINGAQLYCRTIGEGPPMLVLHGGPDFDHTYLLPELDRLADSFSLVYYDQRGRGRSTGDVSPAEVDIASEIEDLDAVCSWFGLESVAVLGHSWGGVLAMEAATRLPDRVSHLLLLNSAPGSAADWAVLREEMRRQRPAGDVERMQAIAATGAYRAGDLDAETEYYRLHFRSTLREPDLLDRLLPRLRAHFSPESALQARAIELKLYEETSNSPGYDVLAQLAELETPTLVLVGEHDFVPVALAARMAEAIPQARLSVLPCGHFAYLERPEDVYEQVVAALLASS
jgi:proline iminopeptidase